MTGALATTGASQATAEQASGVRERPGTERSRGVFVSGAGRVVSGRKRAAVSPLHRSSLSYNYGLRVYQALRDDPATPPLEIRVVVSASLEEPGLTHHGIVSFR